VGVAADVKFCIRDDDTSGFTSPDDLEQAYAEVTRWGPVSLAVVPFHRAGTSKGVPVEFRGQWSVHPLHHNAPLVEYLRRGVADGRYEIMLHGYHHDETGRPFEFVASEDLERRVREGRRYLEDLLGCRIRVFVPPRNSISREGLIAIAREGLHLGGVTGVRSGWRIFSTKTWRLWLKLRQWRRQGGHGIPWVLELDDHREIPGNPVTPLSTLTDNQKALESAMAVNGVFCAATHYWELGEPSRHAGEPTVGGQLRRLIDLARSHPQMSWQSVGDVVTGNV
jgi:Uncharacterized protein conserved in bacteria (DUF2334)